MLGRPGDGFKIAMFALDRGDKPSRRRDRPHPRLPHASIEVREAAQDVRRRDRASTSS
jgi:hypothetical protein